MYSLPKSSDRRSLLQGAFLATPDSEVKHHVEVKSSDTAILSTLESFNRQLPHGSLHSDSRINRRLKRWAIRKGSFRRHDSASRRKPLHSVSPLARGDAYETMSLSHDGIHSKASIADDGRLDIKINQGSGKASAFLSHFFKSHVEPKEVAHTEIDGPAGYTAPPPLNIVMHVVGSRGDVQPFVSLGNVLKTKYGHRVRIATHPVFKQFVEENGLEFFSIGGDPAKLMAFMVKNPGLMPGYNSLRHGDVGECRKDMSEILTRCWRSCIEAGDGTDCEDPQDSFARPASKDSRTQLPAVDSRPFVADAIIANPPSFAHIHCAEKLGVPLHMVFTMPWSPTRSFPHPLANIQTSSAESPIINLISYTLVEMMTWQGLGDIVNRFRKTVLGLETIGVMWAPRLIPRLHVPFTYCWSPALIAKPRDWGSYIDIPGFFFLSSADSYTPTDSLTAFLAAGPPPIYIGFGSIVVEDPYAMTELIFDAIRRTGQRALVSKGWVGLGAVKKTPENIFLIGDVPHDWLFKRVSCVVHHGGAGTTAAGIAQGRPTVVIPFFGDQVFWGAMVARVGAGPTPVPYKELTPARLAVAIMKALTPEALQKAVELAARMTEEKGAEAGAESFHRQLHTVTCALIPTRVAVWQVKRTKIKLSALAAFQLCMEGHIDVKNLKLQVPSILNFYKSDWLHRRFHQREYDTTDRPWGPITGGASSLLGTMGSLLAGVVDFPTEVFMAMRCLWTDPGDEKLRRAIAAARNQSSDPTPSSNPISGQNIVPSSGEHDRLLRTAVVPATDIVTSETQKTIEHVLLGHLDNSTKHTTFCNNNHQNKIRLKVRKRSSRKASLAHRRRWQHRSKEIYLGMVKPLHLIAASKDILGIMQVILTFPMNFMMSLARGFHNAPLIYGDETVREPPHVINLQTGLGAAAKEFGYGIFDGISGIVTQPLRGIEQEGAEGLLKGVGKGFAGLILKPVSAVIGLPTYTIRGLCAEARKIRMRHFDCSIIAARTAQGYEEWQRSTPEDRTEIVRRWQALKVGSRLNQQIGMTSGLGETQVGNVGNVTNTQRA